MAALMEFGVGFGLLCFGLAECMARAMDDGCYPSRYTRIGWAWLGGTVFAAVLLGTVEAIFHTLGVPL